MTLSVPTSTDQAVPGPAAGMVAQLVLLTALTVSVGLGIVGWLTGAACAVVTWIALTHALHRSGMRSLGPANTVTLARATLAGGVAALVADSTGGSAPVGVLVTLATVALLLDAVDGHVARRTGTVSRMGARFDMETDAFLILVLSVFAARSMGAWVLAIGAARYAFVVAAWALPWLRGALPARPSRKMVAALQGVVLVVASAGVVPAPFAILALAVALALLGWSFGRDIGWLWQARSAAQGSAVEGSGVHGSGVERPSVPGSTRAPDRVPILQRPPVRQRTPMRQRPPMPQRSPIRQRARWGFEPLSRAQVRPVPVRSGQAGGAR